MKTRKNALGDIDNLYTIGLTPMGKRCFQRTIWFRMQNLLLSEEEIDEIET